MTSIPKDKIKSPVYVGSIVTDGNVCGLVTEDKGNEVEIKSFYRRSVNDPEIIKLLEEKYGLSDIEISGYPSLNPNKEYAVIASVAGEVIE